MANEEYVYLEYCSGNSDKFYEMRLIESEGKGWRVECNYGRYGTRTPNSYMMPNIPTNRATAERLFRNQLKSKLRKGYELNPRSSTTLV